MLLPEVVNQVDAVEAGKGKKKQQLKTWSVSPEMFPCQLSPDTTSQAKEVRLEACSAVRIQASIRV